jgi:HK97 gp10 family phage protein
MANLDLMDDFLEDLKKYEEAASDANIADVLLEGGNALAEDIRKLPRPRRGVSGVTHMLDTVSAKPNGSVVQVGWGAYYGLFVERGTRKMRAQPHIIPAWSLNKERYYKLMQEKLFNTAGG